MKPYYLQITSSILTLSFTYFLLNSKKNINEILLSLCLTLVILSSQLFWSNPIKNSKCQSNDKIA